MSNDYKIVYDNILTLLNYSMGNNYHRAVKYDQNINLYNEKLLNMSLGNMIFNRVDPLLRTVKNCVPVDITSILEELDKLSTYASKYEVINAPKTAIFEVKINTNVFFL